jgi:hypothetical protein
VEQEAQEQEEQEKAGREHRAREKEQLAAASEAIGGQATAQTLDSSLGGPTPEPIGLWPCDACHQAGIACEPPTGQGMSCQRCKNQKMLCTTNGA